MYVYIYIYYPLVFKHSHGKSPFLIGKPSISMGHLYHGYVTNNQRVLIYTYPHARARVHLTCHGKKKYIYIYCFFTPGHRPIYPSFGANEYPWDFTPNKTFHQRLASAESTRKKPIHKPSVDLLLYIISNSIAMYILCFLLWFIYTHLYSSGIFTHKSEKQRNKKHISTYPIIYPLVM